MKKFSRNDIMVFCAVLLLIGAIGPWITVLGFISAGPSDFVFPEVSIAIFGTIGLTILSALTGRLTRPISIVVGVVALSQVGYVWFHLSEQSTNPMVTPSWGLFLTAATGLFLVISTWIARPQTPMQQYNISSVRVAQPDLDPWDHKR